MARKMRISKHYLAYVNATINTVTIENADLSKREDDPEKVKVRSEVN